MMELCMDWFPPRVGQEPYFFVVRIYYFTMIILDGICD